MTPLLEVRNLALPGRLLETSLDMRAGELVCLVGPNGSGKTSLLHAVAGIGGATGEVRIDGQDPRRLSSDQRKRLFSYLPATRAASWPVTGTEIVALGLPEGADLAAIPPLLARLGLEHLSARRADRMSTGELSRFLIARALVARPKLLLLDEPVANLDPLWQLLLMERLRGCTALVAMHDLDLAARYADRLIVMEGGRIVADDGPAALLDSDVMVAVFGIERRGGSWFPVRPEDRRSSP